MNEQNFSTLIALLQYRSLNKPNQKAFTFLRDGEEEETSLTYQELDRQSRTIAALLQSLGMSGERALLVYPPGLDFIAAFFGCVYAGVTAVPASLPRPDQSLERLQAIAGDALATMVLTNRSYLANVEPQLINTPDLQALNWLATDNVLNNLTEKWQEPVIDKETLAFLQYTSGSTAKPKGVMVSHGNLLYNLEYIDYDFQHTPSSVAVTWLPHFHDMGLIDGLLKPVYQGILCYIMSPESVIQKPVRWLQAISRYRATHSGGPNFIYELCIHKITPEQRTTLDLSSWNVAYNGAESISRKTLEQFAEVFMPYGFQWSAFCPAYGLAEATLKISSVRKTSVPSFYTIEAAALKENRIIKASEHEQNAHTLVGCGRPEFDTKVIIVCPKLLTQCSPSEVGEIWVSGCTVSQGYWNRQEETERTFGAYLANTGEGPFLRTGDLGFLKDGELFITGRLKDLIIIGGRNHYPQDIEILVEKSHPALRSGYGAAFSVEVDGQERLVVVQEVESSYLQNLNVNDVVRAICQVVSEQQGLQVYVVVLVESESIPKTASGKIQRHACQVSFLAGNLAVVGEWRNKIVSEQSLLRSSPNRNSSSVSTHIDRELPTTKTIKDWLVSWLTRQLSLAETVIDIHQPFSYYGLGSVEAMILVGDLESWLGHSLTPTLVWNYPSIAALAQYLAVDNTYKDERSATYFSPSQRFGEEAIAIIGIGCRFPGANNPEEFWQILSNGVNAITEVPIERWDNKTFYDLNPAIPGKLITRWGGFLEQVDLFDPHFFNISPREAETIDPQQRLLLEVAWESLENAGQAPDKLAGSQTGVFVGISTSDYSQFLLEDPVLINAYTATGSAHSIAANRLSYHLDLRGPSMGVDTACSSSLTAVHLACQSLRHGECNLAIAGGVNLMLSPNLTISLSQAQMMAADGRCKTFDAGADGYVRGEGCGIVVLKRLSNALRDGDKILALVQGSAVNQDGRSNGITAPNGLAQQAVICQAMENAGVAPSQISYIEAHGTGTSLGDPIEVQALTTLLGQGRSQDQICGIGSVKTNIGHLEAAAGIAGLIKVVLSLQHSEIPPHLHLKKLNPHISFENKPFFIPTKRHPWSKGTEQRFAGVSSFGFGGTNAHVVIAEAPVPITPSGSDAERPLYLLTLSAKSNIALQLLARRYEEFLTAHPEASLADVCFTANIGRAHLSHRLALTINSREQLCEQLTTFVNGQQTPDLSNPQQVFTSFQQLKEPTIVFMFPGQGAQYVNMALELYQVEPTFRRAVDICSEFLKPHLGLDLRNVLYPSKEQVEDATQQLNQTLITQPAIFTIEYALAKLWMGWGVHPQAMIGHSIGEYVAACLAGVFSLEDALALVAARGRLIQQLPSGSMLAVPLSEEKVQSLMGNNLSLAAVNGPSLCVVSGCKEAVNQLQNRLTEQGIDSRCLHTSHAFHSEMITPILEQFTERVRKINLKPFNIPYVSNVTGTWITDAEVTEPSYWARHLRQTVRFAEGLQELLKEPSQILLEVGPGRTLSKLANHHPNKEPEQIVLASVRHPQESLSDTALLLKTFSQIWLSGVQVDWPGFYRCEPPRRRLSLPTYPFERRRYWINAKSPSLFPDNNLARLDKRLDITDWFYIPSWKPSLLPNPTSSSQAESGDERWLVFVDMCGMGSELVNRLKQKGKNITIVTVAEQFSKLSEDIYTINPQNYDDYDALIKEMIALGKIPQNIAHLWSVNTSSKHQTGEYLEFKSLLFLTQILSRQKITTQLQIWVVSNQIQPINGKETLDSEKAMVLGLCKSIPQEYQNITCRSIDVVLPQTGTWQEEKIIDQILGEFTALSSDLVVAYRDHYRWVQTFEPVRLDSAVVEKTSLRKQGVYLITGGLESIGVVLAEYLAQTVQAKLIFLESSILPEKQEYSQWLETHDSQNEVSCKIRKLQALEELGAEVLVVVTDVTNYEQMYQSLALEKIGQIHGVIHSTEKMSKTNFCSIQEMGEAELEQMLDSKCREIVVLEKVLQGRQLDFCVILSSLSSVLGGFGLAAYSAANVFMDALTYRHNQTHSLPWLTVNWDKLQLDATSKQEANWQAYNKELAITKTEALEVFKRILSLSEVTQVVVSTVDLKARSYRSFNLDPLPDTKSSSQENSYSLYSRPNLSKPLIAPINKLEKQIAEMWQEVLGVEQVGIYDNFFELGGNSLIATQLVSRWRAIFPIELPLRKLLLQASTVAKQAEIIEELLLEKIEELSEEEVEVILSNG
ncbi:MAG: beta-ketoacyl synthase N-terminal-like domain-containing protein [Nostoc sp. DedSLP03]|uniref:polyketide synthase n=1 Tax=Nostoc sp. DedSLP03 TaxID=3075400 RepID=UPI002AD1D192|nr:polyketide synthase [Nostoc sp. DedSLP03]MDZ7965814.1 beta-ketoacyl synthase N-terminal-like domain-containing protein [Nostoc sp. DedSLP03]